MSKLGVYWSVMHRRPGDYEYFKKLNPPVVKIMDGGSDDYRWVRENLPGALVIARDWALSEQHEDMLRDPAGTGVRHAREWANHAVRLGFDRGNTLVLGINEPRVWEPGVAEALRVYSIAFARECAVVGLRPGLMQFSVGWPGNSGEGTPPDWSAYHGVESAIIDSNGMLVCHEYFADKGPSENWGWWCGRSLSCPWNVPIVIGECGVDMYVKDGGVEHTKRGWNGNVDAATYADFLVRYDAAMSTDPRYVGCCVFATDFANSEWWSFDTEPAHDSILASVGRSFGFDVRLPYVSTNDAPGPSVSVKDDAGECSCDCDCEDGMSDDNWKRSREFVRRWEGGYSNDPRDHGNWTGGKQGVGVLKGTKYGISAASYPGLDIENLTMQQADDIYYRDYWVPSGASDMSWPACLLVFDTAVLHGVGTVRSWVNTVGVNPYLIAAHRLEVYVRMDNWDAFGKGWVRRVAELLKECAA
jgi:hypothetical protein